MHLKQQTHQHSIKNSTEMWKKRLLCIYRKTNTLNFHIFRLTKFALIPQKPLLSSFDECQKLNHLKYT